MEFEHTASLTDELLQMAEADQAVRPPDLPEGTQWDNEVDTANSARLAEILDQAGWPTISKVGPEASHAAWLIAQHAPDLGFMKRCLELMRQAYDGEVAPTDMAYLEDRVRILEGRPQLYGTQFQGEGDELCSFPIEDPDEVDARRAAIGLNPFAEHAEQMRQIYTNHADEQN